MSKRFVIAVLLTLLSGALAADEGMWTLDNFPSTKVQEKYGVEIDDEWLARVRMATTRLSGCTGSFVSPDGLVLTNHHCSRRCIADLSTADDDLTENGFLAAERAAERRCPTQQVSVLMEIEEITDKVSAAASGKDEKAANEARKQTRSRLEKECQESSGDDALYCEAVTLYNGGQYFLYKYKRYEDVRLVFAPEEPIAAFGGDPDNFNFPRWCLDMSLLRVYDNGAPIESPAYLGWRPEGPNEDEAVFVTGHPGSTDRQLTVAELKFFRDVNFPLWLLRYSELRGRLIQFGTTGDEAHRIVQAPLMGIENSIKVRRNQLKALLDDEVFAGKMAEEQELKEAVAADPALAEYAGAWDEAAEAVKAYRHFYEEHLFLERAAAFGGSLFDYARDLVRGSTEREKPSEERLREYRDTALPRLQQILFAKRPFYPDLEEVSLTFSLEKMREWLGPDSPHVQAVLGSDSPATRAKALIAGSKLGDPEERKRLWEAGSETIAASEDPMIQLALAIDETSRALRKRYEDEVEASLDAASEKIAAARFALKGTAIYPDATFTLRVTYGAVEGWMEKGEKVEPFTTTSRLFERTTGESPFRLPASWLEAKDKLDPATRFNLVSTTDITGGNSGSPLIDKDANIVGLVFDGNIHAIAGGYWFDETKNRTVSVHPAIILESLDKVYGAEALLEELGYGGE